MNTQKRYKAFGLYIGVIVILALLWMLRDSSTGLGQSDNYTYAQFEEDLDAGNVESVVISQNREVPSGEADITIKSKDDKKTVVSLYLSDVNAIQDTMKEYKFTQYQVKEMPQENWLISILPTLILFGVLFIFYVIMSNHAAASNGGGNKMMNFGKKPCEK